MVRTSPTLPSRNILCHFLIVDTPKISFPNASCSNKIALAVFFIKGTQNLIAQHCCTNTSMLMLKMGIHCLLLFNFMTFLIIMNNDVRTHFLFAVSWLWPVHMHYTPPFAYCSQEFMFGRDRHNLLWKQLYLGFYLKVHYAKTSRIANGAP